MPAHPAPCGIIASACERLLAGSVRPRGFRGAAARRGFGSSDVSVSCITARLAEKGVPGSDRLQKVLVDRNRTLTSILTPTRSCCWRPVPATYVVELVPHAPLWSTLLMTFILLTFGEILPKTLAVSNSRAALMPSRPLLVVTWLLTPLTAAFLWLTNQIVRIRRRAAARPHVTEDDIKTLVNVGVEQNVLEEGEREPTTDHRVRRHDRARSHDAAPRHERRTGQCTGKRALDLVSPTATPNRPYDETIDNVIGMVHDRELDRAG